MPLWTPASLATGALTWLEANTVGATLGIGNGGSVTYWPDDSGNANHGFVNGGFSFPPTLATNQLNSLDVVRFTAAGGQSCNSNPNITTVFTVFAVARLTNTTAPQRVISGGTPANWLLGWWSGHEDVYYFAGGNLVGISPTTTWRSYTATSDGTTTLVYREGTLLYTDVGGAVGGLGQVVYLNNASSGALAEQSDCEIAEVLAFNYVLSTTDRQLTEGYLAWKWGQQATLPSGHPYATYAPGGTPPAGVPRRSAVRRA